MADWFGAAGIIAGVIAFAMAGFVLYAGRRVRANKLLALLLILEGVAQASVAIPFFHDSRVLQVSLYVPHVLATLAEPAVYLLILSRLDCALTRPLRTPAAARVLVSYTSAAFALFILRPGLFYAGLPDMHAATHGGHVEIGMFVAYAIVSFTGLFAIVASIAAYRRAEPGSLKREQAGIFAAAFGTRDLVYLGLLLLYPYAYLTRLFFTPPYQYLYYVIAPAVTLIFVALIAYGILKTQLFDIDVHVKTGIRRTLVAGITLVGVLTVIYLAKDFVAQEFGVLVGSAATGMIILFLPQIRKFSEKAADRMMPTVDESAEYLAYRKLQVYRLALETARARGSDDRSKEMLALLREELRIRREDADALERETPSSAKPT